MHELTMSEDVQQTRGVVNFSFRKTTLVHSQNFANDLQNKNNLNATAITFQGTNLSRMAVAIMRAILSSHQSISKINFRTCNISGESLIQLGECLRDAARNRPSLTLDLGYNPFTADDLIAFANSINQLTCKITIDITGININDEAIANAREIAPNLTLLTGNVSKLQNRFSSTRNNVKRSRKEIDDLNQELKDKQSEVDTLKQTLNNVRSQLNVSNNALATKETAVDSLNDTLDNVRSQLNVSNQALAAKESEVDSLNESLDDVRSQLGVSNLSLAEKKSEVDSLNQTIDDLRSQLDRSNKLSAANREEADNLTHLLTTKRVELDSLDQTLAATRTELNTSNQILTANRADIDITNKALAAKRAELDTSNKTLTSNRSDLQSAGARLNEIQAAISSATQQLTAEQSKLDRVSQTLTVKQDEFAKLEAQCKASSAEFEQLRTTRQAELATLNEQKKLIQDEQQKSTKQLVTTMEEIADAEKILRERNKDRTVIDQIIEEKTKIVGQLIQSGHSVVASSGQSSASSTKKVDATSNAKSTIVKPSTPEISAAAINTKAPVEDKKVRASNEELLESFKNKRDAADKSFKESNWKKAHSLYLAALRQCDEVDFTDSATKLRTNLFGKKSTAQQDIIKQRQDTKQAIEAKIKSCFDNILKECIKNNELEDLLHIYIIDTPSHLIKLPRDEKLLDKLFKQAYDLFELEVKNNGISPENFIVISKLIATTYGRIHIPNNDSLDDLEILMRFQKSDHFEIKFGDCFTKACNKIIEREDIRQQYEKTTSIESKRSNQEFSPPPDTKPLNVKLPPAPTTVLTPAFQPIPDTKPLNMALPPAPTTASTLTFQPIPDTKPLNAELPPAPTTPTTLSFQPPPSVPSVVLPQRETMPSTNIESVALTETPSVSTTTASQSSEPQSGEAMPSVSRSSLFGAINSGNFKLRTKQPPTIEVPPPKKNSTISDLEAAMAKRRGAIHGRDQKEKDRIDVVNDNTPNDDADWDDNNNANSTGARPNPMK